MKRKRPKRPKRPKLPDRFDVLVFDEKGVMTEQFQVWADAMLRRTK